MGIKASKVKLGGAPRKSVRRMSRYVRRIAQSESTTYRFMKRWGINLLHDPNWQKVMAKTGSLKDPAKRKRMIQVLLTIPKKPTNVSSLETAYSLAVGVNVRKPIKVVEVSDAKITFPEVALTVQPSDAPDQKAVHDGESAPAPSPEVTA